MTVYFLEIFIGSLMGTAIGLALAWGIIAAFEKLGFLEAILKWIEGK